MNRTPNTPANGGQILTWRDRMESQYGKAVIAGLNENGVKAICHGAMQAEIADLRASLAAPAELPVAWMKTHTKECTSASHKKWMENAGFGVWGEVAEQYAIPLYSHPAAPAIQTVDRNSVLEEAAMWHDKMAINTGGSRAAWVHNDSAKCIRALKSANPASVTQPAAQSDEPTDREALIACLEDDAAKLADANPDDEMAQTMREAAVMLESDAAQPAAQVAVSGKCNCPNIGSCDGSCAPYIGQNQLDRTNNLQTYRVADPAVEKVEAFLLCNHGFRAPITTATPATVKTAAPQPLKRCAANRDGDCTHPECPQLRDNEPHATGRHCPIDTSTEDEE